jgi:SAM-dependent methyltransferase
VLGWRGGKYQRYGKGFPVQIVRCRNCGLLFPKPFPVPEDPQEIYGDPDEYFADRDVDSGVELRRELVRQIRRRTGLDQPMVLDVGSGRGEFLGACRLERLDGVVGLELSKAMAESCSQRFGIEVLLETIEEHARFIERRYDLIVLSGVLEHVYDPDSLIASAAMLSKPGGMLWIDCPVEPNLLSRVGNAWNRVTGRRGVYNLSPTFEPFHVFGFNPRALARLLAKHQYRLDEVVMADVPIIRSDGSLHDRIRAWGGTQINRLAHVIGQSYNMDAWATLAGTQAAVDTVE